MGLRDWHGGWIVGGIDELVIGVKGEVVMYDMISGQTRTRSKKDGQWNGRRKVSCILKLK